MITLPSNKYLGTLTNLIAYAEVANTSERGKVGDFVDSFQSIAVENGDGKVINSADYLDVEDLSGTSSLLSTKKPTTNEQYISVENYKVIPLTLNKYLMRGAFVNESQLADFVGFVMGLMQATKTAFLSEEIIKKIEGYTPTQSTQTVTIHTINTSSLTDPAQLNQANIFNAKAVQEAMLNVIDAIGFPTNKYNDLAYKETIDMNSMKLIIKVSEQNKILVNSLAELLNSDKITDADKWGSTYKVPDEQFTSKTNEFTAWLMHKNKVQYGYFYQVATSFFDGSTLNENDWLHFAYYLAIVNALPCVCFKIVADITPTALVA